MQKLISFDLYAQFGFLKKPDINKGIEKNQTFYLTYNMLHKPALLGILGAICGLKGYRIEGKMKADEIPEYREKLEELKLAIQPIKALNGNFSKDIIRYTNTVGYASDEEGGVLMTNEQTLISPAYRIYLILDLNNVLQDLLHNRLKNYEAEYIPYLGKNDHQLWWKEFQEWEIIETNFIPNDYFKIQSIFLKPSDEKLDKNDKAFSLTDEVGSYMYFERLPKGWHSELPHYKLEEFLLTDYPISPKNNLKGLMKINNGTDNCIIQVF